MSGASGCEHPVEESNTLAYRARWVMLDPWNIVENGRVCVSRFRIVESGPTGRGSRFAEREVDLGEGLLMAGVVNAHVHLELSAFKGRVQGDGTFLSWVRNLLAQREALLPETTRKAAWDAVRDLSRTGCAAVGDVGTLDGRAAVLERERVTGWVFQEVLGTSPVPVLNVHPPDPNREGRPGSSFAVHAPHTTPGRIFRSVKELTGRLGVLCSFHVAESPDEDEFVRTGKGPWADFLAERGMEISFSFPENRSPVEYVHGLGLLDKLALVVHLTHASVEDLELVVGSGCRVCVCPRSNFAMYGRLPPLETMFRQGLCPALGTDSLAGVNDLQVWNEMAFVSEKFPRIDPRQVLAMGTQFGASALGLRSVLGDLRPGKAARMAYVNVRCHTYDQVPEAVVRRFFSGEPQTVAHPFVS